MLGRSTPSQVFACCQAVMITLTILGAIMPETQAAETQADNAHNLRTITVIGEGQATAAPDMAIFDTGVISEAETASDALRENSEAAAAVLKLLQEMGIARKDIQTTQIDVSPRYSQQRSGRQTEPKIVGYRAANQLRVVVRNLPKLGEILDAVVSRGSNQVSGIRFDIDNQAGLLDQARNRAVRDAMHRAELYAQVAEVRLAGVLSLHETAAAQPGPHPMAARMMAAESVPVATGQLTVTAKVEMTFRMEDQ